MFKKLTTIFLLLTLCLTTRSLSFSDNSYFNLSDLNKGTVTVNYSIKNNIKTKLMLEKDNEKYYYNLIESNQTFPLQLGNGLYTISIFEQKEGNKYKLITKGSFNLELSNENDAYLSSNEIVQWNSNSSSTKLAKELTLNMTTDKEKAYAIYTYIIKNIKYDTDKIATLTSNYLPDAELTLETKKAICYDYASLYAAMTRSIDIPTKLVKGRKNDINVYHAWNEVLIDNEWIIVDTTYNATLYSNSIKAKMYMNSNDYFYEKIY